MLRLCKLICSLRMKSGSCEYSSVIQCSATMRKALGLVTITHGENELLRVYMYVYQTFSFWPLRRAVKMALLSIELYCTKKKKEPLFQSYFTLCVCVGVLSIYVCYETRRGHQILELELQAGVSYSVWMLGTEPTPLQMLLTYFQPKKNLSVIRLNNLILSIGKTVANYLTLE